MTARPVRWLLPGVVCLMSHASARAQDPVVIQRLEGEVRLDGVIDEPAWEGVAPFELVMQTPVYGGPPSERTEVRVV